MFTSLCLQDGRLSSTHFRPSKVSPSCFWVQWCSNCWWVSIRTHSSLSVFACPPQLLRALLLRTHIYFLQRTILGLTGRLYLLTRCQEDLRQWPTHKWEDSQPSPPSPEGTRHKFSGLRNTLWGWLSEILPLLLLLRLLPGVLHICLGESPVLLFWAGLLLDVHCLPATWRMCPARMWWSDLIGTLLPCQGWHLPGLPQTADTRDAVRPCLLFSSLHATWIMASCCKKWDMFLSHCISLFPYAPELSCWCSVFHKVCCAIRTFLSTVILSVVKLSH